MHTITADVISTSKEKICK